MKMIDTNQAFYDSRWAGTSEITKRDRNRVASTIDMVPEDVRSILDVGAGNGYLSNELLARGKSVVAVDISEVALAKVKAPSLRLSADNLEGIQDQSYDLVLCTEMLEHLDEATYVGALQEFNRVAQSAILITVPNQENPLENTTACGDCGHRYHLWSHLRRFTPSDLGSLFPDFRAVSISAFGDNLRRYNPLLLWVRTRLANGWAVNDGSPCPQCNSSRTAPPDRPGLARFCNLVNANLPHLPYKPWLIALYRRR